MKPTTAAELAAQGDTTTMLTPVKIDDLREFLGEYEGHGKLFPRTDGKHARCLGEPHCKGCAMELAIIEAMKIYGKD